ncbi:MAG TPA: glycosyltransferase family 4 protein [Caulobacteraceae bacterium]|jgi:glycosyltransferase involved in cell wall biosynthesis
MGEVIAALSRELDGEPPATGLRREGATPSGRRLRLLHVFPSFSIGGSQMRFASLAAGFGSTVSHRVLALSGHYEAIEIVPPDASVRYLGAPPRGRFPDRLLAHARMIAELRPDVLLTYNWGAIEFALANAFVGRPHLHLEDGFGPEEAARQLRRRVWGRRLALRRSNVLVPSETLRDLALESWGVSPRRLHFVPNGIPARRRPSAPLEALGLELPARRVRLAWVGALRPEKNPVRLLHAFAPLRGRATLLIIGEGPERARVDAAARELQLGDSIRLLGGRRDARDILMQCDMLALSSDTEQMPLVVLEAMDAALPVASFDVGDVRRMVSPENRPFVVPHSTSALSAVITQLVEDSQLRRTVGAANRARATEVYSADAMIRAHRRILDQLSALAG